MSSDRIALAEEIERQMKVMSLLSGDEFRAAMMEMARIIYPQTDAIVAALRADHDAGRAVAMREVVAEAAFLVARLSDFENDHLRDDDGSARAWYGHVDPSLDRLRTTLNLIAIRTLASQEGSGC